MNLLAIIIVFLAILTAGAIAYVAWELSSGDPTGGSAKDEADELPESPESPDRPSDPPAS